MRRKAFSLRVLTISLLLLLGFALSIGSTEANDEKQLAASSPFSSHVQAPLPNSIFLPLVSRNFPLATIFGVGMDQMLPSTGLDQAEEAQVTWIRRSPVIWSDVEPVEGAREWSVLAGLEQELIDAASRGINVLLIVHSTPRWAQEIDGYFCGRIREDKLGAFAEFIHDLVQRYSGPPYNVKNWEIWNEPDVSPERIPDPTYFFGCWGDESDPYYGGGNFAEMLKAVYPKVGQADPGSKVIIGGLLLICDPDNLPPGTTPEDCKPSRFLEGILRANGGPYFDGVSFHAYDYYGDLNSGDVGVGIYSNPNWNVLSNTTGPGVIAKARFIKQVLASYGFPDKSLLNTESGVICGATGDEPPCETSDYEYTKAFYIPQAYAAAVAEGLTTNLWYSLLGWRGSELLDSGMNKLPAYYALQFARQEIIASTFVREITSYSGVKGYELDRGDRLIWVIWSLDGNDHSLTLPSTPSAVYDTFGTEVSASNPLGLNFADGPLYIEWP